MPRYIRNFKKIVYGYASVEANSLEEAKEMFDNNEYDEFDNNSEYEWEDVVED